MAPPKHIVPVDRSRAFAIDELFFSITDRAGVIESCNAVFCRIAGYEPGEILGKPHNIIRHPDMPRAAFKLLWDYLLAGRPVGAYVKNLAKTGEYYWVFALVVPAESGFLSIRLKPSSELLPAVQALYQEALELERAGSADRADALERSYAYLVEGIRGAGFESYDDFMAQALHRETAGRYRAMHGEAAEYGQAERASQRVEQLFGLRSRLCTTSSFFEKLALEIRRVALNASIVASRLKDRGRALGVISQEVSRVADEIDAESRNLKTHVDELRDQLFVASFNTSFLGLSTEMRRDFERETERDSRSRDEEISSYGASLRQLASVLQRSAQDAQKNYRASLGALHRTLARFDKFAEALSRILLTLQFGYVTGKSVSVAIKDAQEFSVLLEDLQGCAGEARAELDCIRSAVRDIPVDRVTEKAAAA